MAEGVRKMPRASSISRRIPSWKAEEVAELTDLLKKYRVLAIIDRDRLPTAYIQMARKIFSNNIVIKVAKRKLIEIALKKVGVRNEELFNLLQGQNIYMFTNVNPFQLAMLLSENKLYTYYKPGDVAESDIVIYEGNTGLSPGPILSTFGKLKIPVKPQGNSIWVIKDTVVARKGDKITPELASILRKLGMALKEVNVKIKAIHDSGVLIPGERLFINVGEYEDGVLRAFKNAIALAAEIAWPIPEVLELSIKNAYLKAIALACEAVFITP
ncbi:MAG: 50S ribosomal protein L10, partial [Desulfurococcaceae archaeon]|nr:50S ribosomal protein L10 [Sulfolobales archaeon]MDW8170822.1 50S ribosomal protein L10 [Desulfurococcaceae archaeon]